MTQSIKVHQKKRGRPPTGRDPLVSARLPEPDVKAIEGWASSQDLTRSEAIRRLIQLGLETAKAAKNS
ncbi:ribbon-helix-helix protein, CopG family [Novacetimonas maltaceti]|uniref:ribbon-helix-helix protein, CopG family n=1 Tax=Novacetimonas maltaceti TaxID=1203393 RepID=UPI000D724E4C